MMRTWTVVVLVLAATHLGDAQRFSLKDKFLLEVAPQLGVPSGGVAPPEADAQAPPNPSDERPEESLPRPDFSANPEGGNAPQVPPSSQLKEVPKGSRHYDFKLEPAPAGFKPPLGFHSVAEGLEAYLAAVEKYQAGGSPVARNGAFRFPYLASLVVNSNHFCSATLIAPRTLLTAAHCVHPSKVNIKKMAVKFFRYKGNVEYSQSIAVASVKLHPQFRYTVENDIALVKLTTAPIIAKPAKYMGQGDLDLDPSERFISLGWGRLSRHSAFAKSLQEVYMPLVGERKCGRALGARIPSTAFCAGMEGRGPCKGVVNLLKGGTGTYCGTC